MPTAVSANAGLERRQSAIAPDDRERHARDRQLPGESSIDERNPDREGVAHALSQNGAGVVRAR